MLTSFQTFKSSILGTRALRRMAGTLLASALVAGSAHAAVLWDQPLGVPPGGVNNAFLSQQFTDFTDLSTYVADDFSNAAAWSISRIFVPGDMWNLTAGTDLSGAVSLNFMIFANSGGQPAGFPGGVVAPQWSGSFSPSDAQITLGVGASGVVSDVTLDLTAPIVLPAGQWWLVFYPELGFEAVGEYGRQMATTNNGSPGLAINPDGGWGFGSSWFDWSALAPFDDAGAPIQLGDVAFRLEGSVPLPSTVLLLGAGLVALAGRASRRREA